MFVSCLLNEFATSFPVVAGLVLNDCLFGCFFIILERPCVVIQNVCV